MQIKIIRAKTEVEKIVEFKNKFLIADDTIYRCYKCNILYCKGETILVDPENNTNHYCPIHTDQELFHGSLEYYKNEFILEDS